MFSFRVGPAPERSRPDHRARAADEIGFRTFDGADQQDGKDAAHACSSSCRPGRGRRGRARLRVAGPRRAAAALIARPRRPAEELWILTDAKGRRVVFAPFRMN
jgi:hypothetical protein